MTGSTAIDVVIGLMFIFLLYSLLASIIQESITTLLGLRSKMLLKSIARMLDDGDRKTGLRQLKAVNFVIELFANISRSFIYPFFNRPLTKTFYEHPTIKYLGESTWNDKPAYLRAQTFSNTLVDLLKGIDVDSTMSPTEQIKSSLENNSSIPNDTRRQLRMLFQNAGGDLEKFKYSVEEWFNEVQERASGWFKKQAQLMLFFIGFILAYAFNVDTIAIAKLLAKNDKLRERFVEFSLTHYKDVYASGTTATSKDSLATLEDIEKARKEVRKAMEDANAILGLGRRDTCLQDCNDAKKRMAAVMADKTLSEDAKIKKLLELAEDVKTTKALSEYQSSTGVAILGWILTAFAISLGAPFWFDLLNKVAKIRSSIKPQAPPSSGAANTTTTGNTNVPPDQRVG